MESDAFPIRHPATALDDARSAIGLFETKLLGDPPEEEPETEAAVALLHGLVTLVEAVVSAIERNTDALKAWRP